MTEDSQKHALHVLLSRCTKEQLIKMATKKCVHRHNLLSHPACFCKEFGVKERIGFLDIEASDLAANFGMMLSWCIKELDGEVERRVIRPDELRSKVKDRDVVRDIIAAMKNYDRIITYYGSGYDLPFIRTRALHHDIEFPSWGEMYHTDVWCIVRKKLKLRRNSMESACKVMGIPAKGHRLDETIWLDAITGDTDALKHVLLHNIEDVESLEMLWKRVNRFARTTKTSV